MPGFRGHLKVMKDLVTVTHTHTPSSSCGRLWPAAPPPTLSSARSHSPETASLETQRHKQDKTLPVGHSESVGGKTSSHKGQTHQLTSFVEEASKGELQIGGQAAGKQSKVKLLLSVFQTADVLKKKKSNNKLHCVFTCECPARPSSSPLWTADCPPWSFSCTWRQTAAVTDFTLTSTSTHHWPTDTTPQQRTERDWSSERSEPNWFSSSGYRLWRRPP